MIVIATCAAWPDGGAGLRLIVDALEERGVAVRCLPWPSSLGQSSLGPSCPDQHPTDHADFCRADLVLPLCVWDYAATPGAFQQWLADLERGGGRLQNSAALIQWNVNKTYLLDLAAKGVPITPTQFLAEPSAAQVRDIMDQTGWQDVVVKPVFGQSGNQVIRCSRDGIEAQDLAARDLLTKDTGILVQPFMAEIETAGEVAFIFIDGQFSHAVHRMPAPGDWRANSQYGMQVLPLQCDAALIDQAAACLTVLDEVPLYARVDGLITPTGFVLSELELIEPALYFESHDALQETAFDRFLDRIITVAAAQA